MATNKPRITLSLEPRAYEVLRRLSAASGRPMSAAVTNFLDVAIPAMERMVVVLEAAKLMPEKTREELRESLAQAEAKLVPALADLVDQADLFLGTGPMERALQATTQEAAAARARKRSTPVPVTRGSGPPKTAKKRARGG